MCRNVRTLVPMLVIVLTRRAAADGRGWKAGIDLSETCHSHRKRLRWPPSSRANATRSIQCTSDRIATLSPLPRAQGAAKVLLGHHRRDELAGAGETAEKPAAARAPG